MGFQISSFKPAGRVYLRDDEVYEGVHLGFVKFSAEIHEPGVITSAHDVGQHSNQLAAIDELLRHAVDDDRNAQVVAPDP